VRTVYVDTSALGRVLLEEPDAAAIQRELDTFDRVIASRLMGVEFRRLALRRTLLDRADLLLAAVSLIPLENQILTTAETLPPPAVGTLDAIHLATALRVSEHDQLTALMTYDKRLTEGALDHGLEVLSPR
jgi:predicted nucleic acid-binding protein